MKSTKKITATIGLVALGVLQVLAQPVIKISDKAFGGTLSEGHVKMTKYDDGRLLIAGQSESPPSGNKTDANCSSIGMGNDIWVLMTDTALSILWDKTFGGNSGDVYIESIFRDDGQIVFSAESYSDSSCEKSQNRVGYGQVYNPLMDYWVCSMDSLGNKLWDKTFGSENGEQRCSIVKLVDGNYLIAGLSDSSSVAYDKTFGGFGNFDIWIVKISPSGAKLWDRCYGGTGAERNGPLSAIPLLPEENGSFVFVCETQSPVSGNITLPRLGNIDSWFVKADSAGNIIWQRRFGGVDTISSIASITQIIKTGDGYLLAGRVASQPGNSVSDPPIGGGNNNADVWLVKTDSMGNKLWDKRYGGSSTEQDALIIPAPGGCYYVGAVTASPAGYDISEPPYGQYDYWIFKIDSAGNKLWEKRYGGPGFNRLTDMLVMPDSSIYLCGSAQTGISATKTDPGYGNFDYWIVRLKENFAFTGIANYEIKNVIDIYPNPTSGELQLSTNLEIRNLMVYDILGNVVLEREVSKQESTVKIDVSALSSGVYFVKAFGENGVAVRKFVKENY